MKTTNIVIDTRTAGWMMERISEDSLPIHFQMGFPYGEPSKRVCAVQVEYSEEGELEATELLAMASERASVMEIGKTVGSTETEKPLAI